MNNNFGTLLVNVLSDFGDISYVIMRTEPVKEARIVRPVGTAYICLYGI